MAVSLSTLITRIRQRSDNEHTGSAFVTDAELTQLINTSYAELYGYLARAAIHNLESTQSIAATGADNYALNGDYYSIVGVFRLEGDQYIRLERHSERYKLGGSPSGTAISYRVMNNAIEFYPRPTGGTYKVVYIPLPTNLSDPSDTLDGVLGWEEYVVIDCAIHVLDKEQSSTTTLREDRDRILARIQDDAAARERTESHVVESHRRYGLEDLLDLGAYTGYRGYRGPIRGRY